MKVKNRRRRLGVSKFPVSFFIHRCRWGCNSSTSSRSSDVIRDSLLESLNQETSFQDTTDLLSESSTSQHHNSNDERLSNSANLSVNQNVNQTDNRMGVDRSGNTDAELLLGATSGDNDSDTENDSGAGAAGLNAMNSESNSNQTNSGDNTTPKDTHSSSGRPRRRTLQEVFQIDIQRELQRQPLSEVRENRSHNRSHPLYNFHNNLLARRFTGNSLAVQVNPLFNLNDRLGRNNLCSPTSLIAQFMQSSQRSSDESESSSLRLGDADIDIFQSEGQTFDTLPRDLPDAPSSTLPNDGNQGSNSSSENADNSTTHTSLASMLDSSYSANLENVRFDVPLSMLASPTGWLNGRISRINSPPRGSPRRPLMNNNWPSGNSPSVQSPNVASYEINPLQAQSSESSDNNSNHSNVGSRLSTNSSESSGSTRVPTQQNWYFYDPRLLPGNRQNRLVMESNFRGVNTQIDVPTILSPPAYDEIGPSESDQHNLATAPPSDPPPPYSDRFSDGGRPPSITYSNSNPSIQGEPPPAYEQSFHHQLGEFSNFPREIPLDDDIDSELSDSLSSSVQLDVEEDDIPSDGPCQAILDNFVLVAGSPSRQTQTPAEPRDIMSLSSSNNRSSTDPISLLQSARDVRQMSTSPVSEDISDSNQRNNMSDASELSDVQNNVLGSILDQNNTDNNTDSLEDQRDQAAVREFFPPPVTARSVFGGRPALRWSRNSNINRWMNWMNTSQPWQM